MKLSANQRKRIEEAIRRAARTSPAPRLRDVVAAVIQELERDARAKRKVEMKP